MLIQISELSRVPAPVANRFGQCANHRASEGTWELGARDRSELGRPEQVRVLRRDLLWQDRVAGRVRTELHVGFHLRVLDLQRSQRVYAEEHPGVLGSEGGIVAEHGQVGRLHIGRTAETFI
jgi:hypothetical protein